MVRCHTIYCGEILRILKKIYLIIKKDLMFDYIQYGIIPYTIQVKILKLDWIAKQILWQTNSFFSSIHRGLRSTTSSGYMLDT